MKVYIYIESEEWYNIILHTTSITYLIVLCSLINNKDMIKISHVMTIYTNKYVYVVYNFVLYVYKWMYCLYMYCKLNNFLLNLPAIHLLLRNKWIWCYINKTEANLASTKVLAARCVRVIHAQCVLQFALLSRTLLRSSSNNEPSDPPYRIIFS